MSILSQTPTAKRKSTAKDVAREAGVSKWTVNRAFKAGAPIGNASRKRILEVAQRIGYRPNLLARSLATKSTQQVAVLVDDFDNPHKLQMLKLLTAALQREGLIAALINVNQPNDHVDAIFNADQRQLDAVVLVGTSFHDEALRANALHSDGPPLFVLGRESTLDNVTAVSCDAQKSMSAICRLVWGRGYRRPGFMSGPRAQSTALGRMREFETFWVHQGVGAPQELSASAWDRIAAGETMARYLSTTPKGGRIDILMCEDDALAIGAMDVARFTFGLTVPADLGVVGYDGIDLAGSPSYDLTTYEQPTDHMIDALIAMVVGRAPRQSVNLEGRLVVRGST
jgi:LacI family transcriptional regulator